MNTNQNNITSLEGVDIEGIGEEVDIFIGAVGYERRARFGLQKMLDYAIVIHNIVGCSFASKPVLDFEKNRDFFETHGGKIVAHEMIRKEVENLLLAVQKDSMVKVVCDISSLTREKLAILVSTMHDFCVVSGCTVSVYFLYSSARFSRPPSSFGPVKFHGPVLPEFAGKALTPQKGVSLMIGLGYEIDIALGVLEIIEPAQVVGFLPEASDQRFLEAIHETNNAFIRSLEKNHLVTYPVNDPVRIFNILMNVCSAADPHSHVVLVPFGPKIFSLISLMVSIASDRRFPVWRVSALDNGVPNLSIPSGGISVTKVVFG